MSDSSTEPLPVVHGPLDGNIFAIVGACMRMMKRSGQKDQAEVMAYRVSRAKSYAEALSICGEYVEFDL